MHPTEPTRPSTRAILLAAAACAACGGDGRPPGPDVVLISLDSVRADALTFLDAEATPRLFELARRGTVFTQACSGSSWTLPAHAQLFTGLPPVVHGVQEDSVRIDPLTPTLPELLERAGYLGLGFFSGWYLAGEFGFSRGFALYRNVMTRGADEDRAQRDAVAAGDLERATAAHLRKFVANHKDVTSANLADACVAALDELDPEDRLFLFAHFFDPHFDFVPPPPFDSRFDPDYDGGLDGRDYWSNRAIFDAGAEPPRRVSDRDLHHLIALYEGEIAWVDAAIGRILDRLEELGRLEGALIVVTADHGEEFFEHGNRGHRRTLFDEVLRVPLLIVPPSAAPRTAARTSDALVSLSDVLPTIIDYAGIDEPVVSAGRSLRPALEGRVLAARPVIATLSQVRLTDGGKLHRRVTDCIRTRDWKLIRRFELAGNGAPVLSSAAYFDLARDPRELDPVVDLDDPALRKAWRALERELDVARALSNALPHSPPADRGTRAREAFAGDLGALGYAGDDEQDSPSRTIDPAALPLPPLEPLPRLRLPRY